MSCANMYDWIEQSQEHKRYAMTNYPVAAHFARISDSYEHFISLVQDFRTGEAGAYRREFNEWWHRFGSTWNELGCPHEYVLGEHTDKFKFHARPTPNANMRQRDYGAFTVEGPRLSLTGMTRGLAGKPIVLGQLPSTRFSCFGRPCAGLGQTNQSVWEDPWEQSQTTYDEPADIETGQSDMYEDEWWTDTSDYDVGTPSMMPELKDGYHWCRKPPSGVKMVQSPKASDGAPGWTVAVFSGADNQLYYRYDHAQTNVRRWACPTSNIERPGQKADVRLIQKALKEAGYPPGPIDGIVGPKTCAAAYKFQRERVGVMGADLTRGFFQALGLGGRDFEVKYARLCAFHHKDVYMPPDEPEPSKPDKKKPPKKKDPVKITVPEEKKAGFPWLLAGVLGLGAGVTAFMTSKKKKKRRK